MIKFAIPVKNGKLDSHFGHAALFAIIEADQNSGEIKKITPVTPPPHAPGVIPEWIANQGVTVVIANKMGDKAKQMLAKLNVKALTDIVPAAPDELVKMYFSQALVTAPAASCCGQNHGHDHEHDHEHGNCHGHQKKTACHSHGNCHGGGCRH